MSRVDLESALLSVPNVSEGRDAGAIEQLSNAFTSGGVRLLDLHSDVDHNRSVFSLAGSSKQLCSGMLSGAGMAVRLIDMTTHTGQHPCIGAIDVAPIVYLDQEQKQLAQKTAQKLAAAIAGDLGLPVFFYGELASTPERRERTFFRRGGINELRERVKSGELTPDVGQPVLHPTAGATIVTARPPLVAFNIELDTHDLALARRIGEEIREASGGLPGLRAIGVHLEAHGRSQVSTNVEDSERVPLRVVVETVREIARHAGVEIACAEIVGLVPSHALDGFPIDIEIRSFDRDRQILDSSTICGGGTDKKTQT